MNNGKNFSVSLMVSFADAENNFVIHTYLSILAKILAYEVVSNDEFIDDEEMKTY